MLPRDPRLWEFRGRTWGTRVTFTCSAREGTQTLLPGFGFSLSSGSTGTGMALPGLAWLPRGVVTCVGTFWGQNCQGNEPQPREWDAGSSWDTDFIQEGGIPSEHPTSPEQVLLDIPQEEGRRFSMENYLFGIILAWQGWAERWGPFPEEWERPSSSWIHQTQPRAQLGKALAPQGKQG